MTDESLPGRFAAAQQLYGAIDNTSLAGNDPALQAQIAAALGGFEGVSDMARALSLFSSNEDLDDVEHPDVQTQKASFTNLATEQDQPTNFTGYVTKANQKHKRSTKSIINRNIIKTEETDLNVTLK